MNRELLAQARTLLEKSVQRTSEGKDVTLMLKLVGVVDEMTDVIARLLGSGEDKKLVDERQAFRPPWIADLLRSLGDPGWSLFKQQREGGTVGCQL